MSVRFRAFKNVDIVSEFKSQIPAFVRYNVIGSISKLKIKKLDKRNYDFEGNRSFYNIYEIMAVVV